MSSPPPTSPPPMVWPAPPGGNVVPFPLPWGQTGCCPPGGMSGLMQCYNDIQAATAFICSVMVDCINKNPAVTAAIIAAIEASGSSLPLIGVTNGSDAQPGQVGEYVQNNIPFSYTAAAQTQLIQGGILQPGDWQLFGDAIFSASVNDAESFLSPLPAGVSGNQQTDVLGKLGGALMFPTVRASLSVPTLFVYSFTTNSQSAGTAGTGELTFIARRMR